MEEVAYHVRSRDVIKNRFPPCLDSRRSMKSPTYEELELFADMHSKFDFVTVVSSKSKSLLYDPPFSFKKLREGRAIFFLFLDNWLQRGRDKVEITKANLKWCASWAKKALEYYNSKRHTNFKLVEVKLENAQLFHCLPTYYLAHMNFKAESVDVDSMKCFYAALNVPLCMDKEDEILVKECCILDAENPNPKICSLCGSAVVHPSAK